jgi:hypothetical protein
MTRDFAISFVRALRSPPDNGVGRYFGAMANPERRMWDLAPGLVASISRWPDAAFLGLRPVGAALADLVQALAQRILRDAAV